MKRQAMVLTLDVNVSSSLLFFLRLKREREKEKIDVWSDWLVIGSLTLIASPKTVLT